MPDLFILYYRSNRFEFLRNFFKKWLSSELDGDFNWYYSLSPLILKLYGNSISWYNAIAIGEDRATLGSDPSALIAAYNRGHYPCGSVHLQAIYIYWCPQFNKSTFVIALARKTPSS